MSFALNPDLPQNLLSNLIVADIAPSRGDLSPEFMGYVDGMRKIESSKVSSRKEAQEILSEYEKVRFFLVDSCDISFRSEDCSFHPIGRINTCIPSNEYLTP